MQHWSEDLCHMYQRPLVLILLILFYFFFNFPSVDVNPHTSPSVTSGRRTSQQVQVDFVNLFLGSRFLGRMLGCNCFYFVKRIVYLPSVHSRFIYKRKEYIIYIYTYWILWYCFEVGIEKHFASAVHAALRCYWRHLCCPLLQSLKCSAEFVF